MKVILLRHAARDFAQGTGDSALSSMGRSQAQYLTTLVAPRGSLPAPAALLASPKKRTRETLAPLSALHELKIETEARLDERLQNETSRDFNIRIASFLTDIQKNLSNVPADSAIYICSHADWLEAVLPLLASDLSETEAALGWSNAEYKIFRVENSIWHYLSSGVASPVVR
jgi:broad specificity phosphatase PhoE